MSITEIYRTMAYGTAPEGAELAHEWLDAHGRSFGHYIDGAFTPAPTNEGSFEVFNPAKGGILARVAQGTKDDVDRAVAAARRAQPVWASCGGYERAKVLYALARLIQRHSRLLAVLETLDNGKPIRETRDLDIPLVARHFYHHAGWAQAMTEEMPGAEPVGVCGQIIPWNFPLLMLAWKIAPALATGNTVVLKPAEFTPLTALLFAELCTKAGVPAGVVNIVTGDGETGRHIVEHPDVDKIAFTGSTEVGRILRKATADTKKKLSLELGGKSPFVVFEDADLDSAIEGVVDAIWFNQGQVCCAGSRLLVQESIADRFYAKLKVRMETLRVGDPLDKAVDIGAIVAPVQLERIQRLVGVGVEEGAEIFQPTWACPTEGWFYPPTLLTNVGPASTVVREEIFGPVLVAMTFRTPKEAVELANNTPYGLAASVWTENVSTAHDVAAKIKAGTVWVNCTNQFDASSGFGGYRESGYGREGGIEGLWEYVKTPVATPGATSAPTPRPESSIDRTHKHYIGGKQVRPDSGYSLDAVGEDVPRGNRKDLRNAVEAAAKAQSGWGAQNAHARAQVLYFLAENLQAMGDESAVRAVFEIAARCDKFEGRVHDVPMRAVCLTRNEPIGVVAIVCSDDRPLIGLLESVAAAIAMGNAVVVVPSEADPVPAMELYRVLETSDIPAGVVNIVTGLRKELVPTLADHDAIDAIWFFGPETEATDVRQRSAANLKRVWTGPVGSVSERFRQATQVKNIWVPYGA